jgi:hypothetical protein
MCMVCSCKQVRHETPVRLRVKVSPAGVKRYEVPETLLPRYVDGISMVWLLLVISEDLLMYHPWALLGV